MPISTSNIFEFLVDVHVTTTKPADFSKHLLDNIYMQDPGKFASRVSLVAMKTPFSSTPCLATISVRFLFENIANKPRRY